MLVILLAAVALGAASGASGASASSPAAPLLAATPPMGWNPWYLYGCSANQQRVEQTARAIVGTGMSAAGYSYVNLDDCWMAAQRDSSGALQADPVKFPDGIAALATYVHGLGLKLGVYLDAGARTCQGLAGSAGHFPQDAATLAAWQVDFVKVDYCATGMAPPEPLYRDVSRAFASVSWPILLSVCEWGFASPWRWAPQIASMWRTTGDITSYGTPTNTWRGVLKVTDLNARLSRYARPGHWNDPDMLLAGTGLLSTAQARSQFSLWSMMAAPLLSDADLIKPNAATRAILTNPEVIAIDQDPAGRQGRRIANRSGHQLWLRQLTGISRALLMFNATSRSAVLSADVTRLGLPAGAGYLVRDLWSHRSWLTRGPIRALVGADDVLMLKIIPLPGH